MEKRGKRRRLAFFGIGLLIVIAFLFLAIEYSQFGKISGMAGTEYIKELSSCGQAFNSGYSYLLTQDIVFTGYGSCFLINASNVTLDCQKHKLTFSYINNPGNPQFPADAPRTGIYINESNVSVTNCDVVGDFITGYGSSFGLYINSKTSSGVIASNTLNNNVYGLFLQAGNLSISSNEFVNNSYGLNLKDVSYSNFSDNLFENNSIYGVFSHKSNGLVFKGNQFKCNPTGAYFENGGNITLNNNYFGPENCSKRADQGASFISSSQNLIKSNSFLGYIHAINLEDSSSNNVSNNDLRDNFFGISLLNESNDNFLWDNSFGNSFDIFSDGPGNIGNNFEDNDYYYSFNLGERKYGNNVNLERLQPYYFSISMWARGDEVNENWALLNLFGRDSLRIRLGSGGRYYASFNISNSSGSNHHDLLIGKQDGLWHNLGISFNLSNRTVSTYFDGKLNSTYIFGTGSSGLFVRDRSLFVGASAINSSEPLNTSFYEGDIDDLRIYNIPLSGQRFSEIADSGRQKNNSLNSYGLVGWYNFDNSDDLEINSLGNFNELEISSYNTVRLTSANEEEIFIIEVSADELIQGYSAELFLNNQLKLDCGGVDCVLTLREVNDSLAVFFAEPLNENINFDSIGFKKIDLNSDFIYDLALNVTEINAYSSVKIYARLISEPFSSSRSSSRDSSSLGSGQLASGTNLLAKGGANASGNSGQSETSDKSRFLKISVFFIFGILVLAIIIIAVYIIYELVRSRTGSELTKAFPAYDPNEKGSF